MPSNDPDVEVFEQLANDVAKATEMPTGRVLEVLSGPRRDPEDPAASVWSTHDRSIVDAALLATIPASGREASPLAECLLRIAGQLARTGPISADRALQVMGEGVSSKSPERPDVQGALQRWRIMAVTTLRARAG